MKRLLPVTLLTVLTYSVPVAAQVPCSAITKNPLVLEALIGNHLAAERELAPQEERILIAAEIDTLKFEPVPVQPGDALYVEYRGRAFTFFAGFRSGDMIAFDSPPKADGEQWRRGILLMDERMGANQLLVGLSVAKRGDLEPQFRNVRIIRAGQPGFEFTKLVPDSPPIIPSRPLPCIPSQPAQTMAANPPFTGGVPFLAPAAFAVGAQPVPAPYAGADNAPLVAVVPPASPSGQDGNHYKFTGQEFDPESGLYNYKARQYSPNLGRFMSPDEFTGGPVDAFSATDPLPPGPLPYADLTNPQSLNKYAYTYNNPLNYIDSDGHNRKRALRKFIELLPPDIQKKLNRFVQLSLRQQLKEYKTATKTLDEHIARKGATDKEVVRLKSEVDAMGEALRKRGLDLNASVAPFVPFADVGEELSAAMGGGFAGEVAGTAVDVINPFSGVQEASDLLSSAVAELIFAIKALSEAGGCAKGIPDRCHVNIDGVIQSPNP